MTRRVVVLALVGVLAPAAAPARSAEPRRRAERGALRESARRPLPAPAPIDLSADLELLGDDSGNLDGWSLEGPRLTPLVTVNTNNPPGTWQWLHFRATGVAGKRPRFRTNTVMANAGSNDVYGDTFRMSWRYEDGPDTSWHHFDHGRRVLETSVAADGWPERDHWYHAWHATPFERDAIRVAYWPAYSTADLRRFLDAVVVRDQTGFVGGFGTYGLTYGGRDMYRFQLTDESVPEGEKVHVVLTFLQHGMETTGGHVMEAMVHYLLSDAPEAVLLRRGAIVHFYPTCNPDGVAEGGYRQAPDPSNGGQFWIDPNRDWPDGSRSTGGDPSRSFAIDAARDDIVAETGGAAWMLIDVHSHPKATPLGWYWWQTPADAFALEFMTTAWELDRAGGPAADSVFEWPTLRAGSTTAGTASGWGINTLGAASFTLEPTPVNASGDWPVTLARYGQAARAILRAMAAHLPN